ATSAHSTCGSSRTTCARAQPPTPCRWPSCCTSADFWRFTREERPPRARLPDSRSGRSRGRSLEVRSEMTSAQVQRTLVKSPPELWAELSDPAALARHLGELGEIRITRIEPEHKVEWTAEGASGTVLINPSAWGTRVTLTARRTSHEPELAPGSDSTTPPVSVQASGQTHPGPSVPASD